MSREGIVNFACWWENSENTVENLYLTLNCCLQDRKAGYGAWKREKYIEGTQRTNQWKE